jgi:hypothetical protein
MINNTSAPTLETVHQQFISWRSHRNNKSKIPQELWQCVKSLHTHYPYTTICKRLGLSSSQYKKRMQPIATSADNQLAIQQKPPKQEFISIPIVNTPLENYSNLTIVRPDGIKLHINQCSKDYILTIIKAL